MRRPAPSRRLLLAPPLLAVLAFAASTRDARAGWPPPPGATTEQLKDPANWPNDPDYGPRDKDGKPSLTGTGGTWQQWSWIPPRPAGFTQYRKTETAAGMSGDVAWTYTTGDPRVRIAVLDSGIKWDAQDIIHTAFLNAKELVNAKPLDESEKPCGGDGELAGFDCNKDGVFDLYDYEVSKKVQTKTGVVDFTDSNKNGVLDPGDLIVSFSDGVDDDGNGYTDDISGWDFFKDDNDPYDDTRYGHGTGEAEWSTAEANNGKSGAGFCPKCQHIPLRVGDSFIVDVQDYAQAVTYAVDIGAKVVQEALGSVNQSNLARKAMDHAWSKGTVIIASAADENSRHHNMPATANHTLIVHAIQKDNDQPAKANTFLAFHPCSNFGGQIPLSASGSGCASEATGNTSGIAGLIYSMGLKRGLVPELSAGEIEQILKMSADLIDVPESYDENHPEYDPTLYYPSKPTFSQRFGYGRINAGSAVKAVAEGKIPPVVDLVGPELFETIYPAKLTGDVPIRGLIKAREGTTFEAKIQWAAGVEPDEDAWQTIATIPSQPGGGAGFGADGTPLAFFKAKDLKIDNTKNADGTPKKGAEVENKYTITLRVQATVNYPGVGAVKGEARRPLYVHDDPTLLPGFPKYLGASGEAHPRLVDIDGDGKRDILYPTADGLLHAFRADGTEIPGWPFKTRHVDGLQPSKTEASPYVQNYLGGENAWTTGGMDPDLARETLMSAPAIGDVDGDGKDDIVFGTWSGTIYAIHKDGTPVAGKWPMRLPDVPSCPRGDQPPLPEGTTCMDTEHGLARGAFAGVVLTDMNKDGKLDVVVAAFDGKVYVWDGKGDDLPGFPVLVDYTGKYEVEKRVSRIVTTPTVGDINGDGIPEIGVGSNEYLTKGGTIGAFFLVDGRGNAAPGGPYLPDWPATVGSFKLFPLVGEGIVSAGLMADVDGDGVPEVIFHGTGDTPVVLPAKPGAPAIPGGPFPNPKLTLDPQFGENYLSPTELPGNNFIGLFSQPSVGDLDQDGKPDVIALGSSFFLALALASPSKRDYEQHVAFWNSSDIRPCTDGSGRNCAFMFPGSPTITEDYTFFHNATVADLSGDGYPEVVLGTGGYYVRAVDACGREAPGFPKFTGGWIIPSVTMGDLDGDGSLEVVTGTRDGWLYAWHTEGREDGVIEWPTYHHDNQNTGNYATKLDFPNAKKASKPLDLATCKVPDQGPPPAQAEADTSGFGCGCDVPGRSSAPLGFAGLAAALGLAVARRRRS